MTNPTLSDVQAAIAAMDAATAKICTNTRRVAKDYVSQVNACRDAADLAIQYCRTGGWLPIESAPRDEAMVFWLVPIDKWHEWDDGMRSSDDLGPVPQFKPYAWIGKFNRWRSHETAASWQPIAPPVAGGA